MSLFDDELSPAPAETWWDFYGEHRELPMEPQVGGWTCSICATDWLLRATGLDPHSNRIKTAFEIGYPSCVDEYSGLKDTNCLVRVLESFGVQAAAEWVDWERAMDIASSTAFIANSTRWYHFTGGRGTRNGGIWVANSAPGYQGIADDISRAQFEQWAGSWKFVYLAR